MTTLEIAHIREQGQDIIFAPLDDSFDHKTSNQQQAIIAQIQFAASSAGLAGTVVPVWEGPSGRMRFIAPQPWHPYIRGLSMNQIVRSTNKTLSW